MLLKLHGIQFTDQKQTKKQKPWVFSHLELFRSATYPSQLDILQLELIREELI